jgi:galactokinase
VALVDAAAASRFAREVARQYEKDAGLRPSVYVCTASEGASLEAA